MMETVVGGWYLLREEKRGQWRGLVVTERLRLGDWRNVKGWDERFETK